MCAGGSVCPADTACAVVSFGTLCVPNDGLRACKDLEPFASCGEDLRCYETSAGLGCLASGCGNGFLDPADTRAGSIAPAEQCDDHNNESGDGCAADCSSNETCGNLAVDLVDGEQCDDGDHVSGDGCSSLCLPERPEWIPRFEDNPEAQDGMAVAYDPRRARLVWFGGDRAVAQGIPSETNLTFEWSGRAWTRAAMHVAPAARGGAAMAYDEVRRSVLMFGGAGAAVFGDTWEWSGNGWSQLDPPGPMPSAREGSVMVTDLARQRIVMFAGNGGTSSFDDTWEWDGTRWLDRSGPVRPPATDELVFVYDARRGVSVLCAGLETWEYADGTWTPRSAAPVAARVGAFDPIANRVVIFGVRDGQNRAWEWDGSAWSERVSGPPGTPAADVAFSDPVRKLLVVFTRTQINQIDAEEWDGSTWRRVPSVPPVHPGQVVNLTGAAAAATGGSIVLFGGLDPISGTSGSTWSYDGARWTQQPLNPSPSNRYGHVMAHDSARDRAVLFGGRDGPIFLADTWTWNGVAWTREIATGPSARSAPAMTYDAKRDRVVMFGGQTGAASVSNETWEWTGTGWQLVPPAGSPPGKFGAAMAYDPIRQQVVMFGGGSNPVFPGADAETWTYDGGWQRRHPTVSPPRRENATLTWDASRGRLVLVGGSYTSPPAPFSFTVLYGDAWEWDGSNWRQVPATADLSPRHLHVAFSPPEGSGVMVVGGDDNGPADTRTPRVLRWTREQGAAAETCEARVDQDGDGLAGCADPDCWARCQPRCPPESSGCSTLSPRCGDGACSSLESANICPVDCGATTAVCGDLVCDPGEACVGDCPPP